MIYCEDLLMQVDADYEHDDTEEIWEQLYAQMIGWTELGPNKCHYKQGHRYDCNCKCGK